MNVVAVFNARTDLVEVVVYTLLLQGSYSNGECTHINGDSRMKPRRPLSSCLTTQLHVCIHCPWFDEIKIHASMKTYLQFTEHRQCALAYGLG